MPEKLLVVQAVMLIEPVLGPLEGDELVRTAVARLPRIDGEPFTPMADRDRRFLERSSEPRAKTRVQLTHASLAKRSHPDGCYVVMGVDNDRAGRFTILGIDLYMGRVGEQLDLEWDVFLQVAPGLIAALRPTLVLANGLSVDDDDDEDALPEITGLASDALSPAFTPFTYLGPRRLNARLVNELSVLPAYRSARLGEGWMVQTTERPDQLPSRELVTALRNLGVESLWAK